VPKINGADTEMNFSDFIKNLFPNQTFDWKFLKLMGKALTHPSYNSINNYEKLETIGDAALDLIVSEWFYENHAESPKQISEARSSVVCNKSLAKVAKKLRLDFYLRVANGYRILRKDLADTLEAVIGAVKITFGFDYCKDWIISQMSDIFEQSLKQEQDNPNKWGRSENNYVNILQEYTQFKFGVLPNYYGLPSGNRDQFTIVCQVKDIAEAVVTARSKKQARKLAAQKVCEDLNI